MKVIENHLHGRPTIVVDDTIIFSVFMVSMEPFLRMMNARKQKGRLEFISDKDITIEQLHEIHEFVLNGDDLPVHEFADSQSEKVRAMVAWYGDKSEHTKLSTDPCYLVRMAVAVKGNEWLRNALMDEEYQVSIGREPVKIILDLVPNCPVGWRNKHYHINPHNLNMYFKLLVAS